VPEAAVAPDVRVGHYDAHELLAALAHGAAAVAAAS
jgi:hypothetical protein